MALVLCPDVSKTLFCNWQACCESTYRLISFSCSPSAVLLAGALESKLAFDMSFQVISVIV